jgi:hypothetical protein
MDHKPDAVPRPRLERASDAFNTLTEATESEVCWIAPHLAQLRRRNTDSVVLDGQVDLRLAVPQTHKYGLSLRMPRHVGERFAGDRVQCVDNLGRDRPASAGHHQFGLYPVLTLEVS